MNGEKTINVSEAMIRIEVVPQRGTPCDNEHGIDVLQTEAGETFVRCCPCLKVRFPQSDALQESMERGAARTALPKGQA